MFGVTHYTGIHDSQAVLRGYTGIHGSQAVVRGYIREHEAQIVVRIKESTAVSVINAYNPDRD